MFTIHYDIKIEPWFDFQIFSQKHKKKVNNMKCIERNLGILNARIILNGTE